LSSLLVEDDGPPTLARGDELSVVTPLPRRRGSTAGPGARRWGVLPMVRAVQDA